MNKISAKIIADSKNEFGQRLTTFVLTFPRIVLAEFNTHRMFSRNSASSRAIPFKKMLKMVQEDPFIPIKWMKEHSGMQGTEYFTDEEAADLNLRYGWIEAGIQSVKQAEWLSNRGLTKQMCNRLLEPWMWHTVIVTASEWENFFALRAHEAAEIHIQELAHRMLEQYNIHQPKQLKAGEWHIPFGDTIDYDRVYNILTDNGNLNYFTEPTEEIQELKVKIATARCARVSYLNFEGKDDYEADIQLHDRLLSSGHMSPFEHCARAMSEQELYSHIKTEKLQFVDLKEGRKIAIDQRDIGWSGNFQGFIQYRKTIEGENKSDNRVKR